MVIGRVTDGMIDGVGRLTSSVTDTVSEAFMEPVVRLGVTGLSGAGKTVFITALVHNLMNRARMGQLRAVASDRIAAAYLQPQPDDTLPRFDFETHLAALTGPEPHWPESTRAVSELRLSFRLQPGGLFGPLRSAKVLHLDIIDYPGEWLLDLSLIGKSYRAWAEATLARMAARPFARAALERLQAVAPDARHDEQLAKELAARFTDYLRAARGHGHADVTPGRFLLPGQMEGSPALTFAPLPGPSGRAPRRSLLREMERRFEAYKNRVVQPFFRNHFARIDRQVVLVDVLDALHHGPGALTELGETMSDVLTAFRPGGNAWLSRLLRGRRVERILFAATKADHLHHAQHARLTGLVQALLRGARDRADFAGARTDAQSIAALRATVEETRHRDGQSFECVRGRLLDGGRQAAFYPGELPEDPLHLLAGATGGGPGWLDGDYSIMRFAPAALSLKPGEGVPHIRLDRAAEFLIGDRLA